jgi:hypothetical protein
MKLCCCSRVFAQSLQTGALTQLEWIDRTAELGADGIEFGASHFPRTDDDYLAQLKKLCVDLGLTVASIALDVRFAETDVDRDAGEVGEWIDRALALGAPLVRLCCGAPSISPPIAWREAIRGFKIAGARAKDRNVTLALAPADGSLIASAADAKRALKESDSAWLRIALPSERLGDDDAGEWLELSDQIVFVTAAGELSRDAIRTLEDTGYVGFVSLDGQNIPEPEIAATLASMRRILRAVPVANE